MPHLLPRQIAQTCELWLAFELLKVVNVMDIESIIMLRSLVMYCYRHLRGQKDQNSSLFLY